MGSTFDPGEEDFTLTEPLKLYPQPLLVRMHLWKSKSINQSIYQSALALTSSSGPGIGHDVSFLVNVIVKTQSSRREGEEKHIQRQ